MRQKIYECGLEAALAVVINGRRATCPSLVSIRLSLDLEGA